MKSFITDTISKQFSSPQKKEKKEKENSNGY